MDIQLGDFHPVNSWIAQEYGSKHSANRDYLCARSWESGTSRYVLDNSTRRFYFNESQTSLRLKCTLLTLSTPFIHSISSVCNAAFRALKLVAGFHFWTKKDLTKEYNFKERLFDAYTDILRIIATPIALLGLELSAIYGLYSPYDGRKLYASIESALYDGSFTLASCFQPQNPYQEKQT